MKQDNLALKRFAELAEAYKDVKIIDAKNSYGTKYVDKPTWQKWATSVLNLIQKTFGEKSPHYLNFSELYIKFTYSVDDLETAMGIFFSD
jgi:hypothetical protein